MNTINLIVSNGPHGKFMAARGDHSFLRLCYTMINREVNPINRGKKTRNEFQHIN